MPCSVCKQVGHNVTTCPNKDEDAPKIVKNTITSESAKAAKARWDALSEEEKLERLNKMAAGRALAQKQ